MSKNSVTFVLFGGTGDLTKKKLVPAFSSLIHSGKIEKKSTIIGVSRNKLSDKEYRKLLLDSVEKDHEKKYISSAEIRHIQGDFLDEKFYSVLKEELNEKKPFGDRIYYFSTSYKYFSAIVEGLKKENLHRTKNGSVKVVFEKPFGHDLISSIELDKELHNVFSEKNIYRLDHYLAKDTVLDINVLKFVNPLIYGTFNNKFIESIEVNLDENIGVEKRLEYYNSTGAVKDMFQSHILQILSLLLMEEPVNFSHESVTDEKIKVLKKIRFVQSKKNVLGRYASFSKQLSLAKIKDNKVDTFARIILECGNQRWKGVEISTRFGKMLNKRSGKIIINYRPSKKPREFFGEYKENKIEININPNQNAQIQINYRDPKCFNCISPIKFDFCHDCFFGPNSVDAYAILLEEIIKGNKMYFARFDEVKEAWRIVEEIDRKRDSIKNIIYDDFSNPDKLL